MGSIFDNLKQIGQMKQQAAQLEKILRSKTVEVSSPKGEIKMSVNGKMEILDLDIDSEVLKPENKNYIEKLFKNTFLSAKKEVERMISLEMKSQMGL